MKILVLSDTHGYIDERILHYAKAADQVWHAGDIGSIDVVDKMVTRTFNTSKAYDKMKLEFAEQENSVESYFEKR